VSPISLFIINVNKTSMIEIAHTLILQYWSVTLLSEYFPFAYLPFPCFPSVFLHVLVVVLNLS